ncbi:thioredoxin domain-containing protein [Candidatus Nomurabacteria bacterium]|nr:thioredoxin domain-containing protein [Candidatus Nomurabacteria bacterium]
MEKEKKLSINTPTAIIVAGFLVMLALLITRGGSGFGAKVDDKDKTLSERVGIKKEAFSACVAGTDKTALQAKISTSVEAAMKGLKPEERGTPYSIIVGKNGSKTEVRGALPIDQVQKLITEVSSGKVTTAYKGEVALSEEGDHLYGSADAPVVIIEYSDYECPYCARFHPEIKQIVDESKGGVAWIYRHWPIHAGSLDKLIAAECVAKLKGNDAFWKYSESLFELINPTPAAATSNL